MTELVLIRHGETDWNRELRFQGQVDVPLNATGHAQARRLAERLAGTPAQALYASDLARAVQTALPIAPVLGAPLPDAPVPEPGLREQAFGIVDGWSVDEIRRAHPQAWDAWTRFDEAFAFDGGESTRQFHARVLDAVMRLAQRHTGQTLVIVTHGGVLDMLFRSARGLSLSGPRSCDIPNAGLNRMRLDRQGRLHILDWADTRHLDGLPPQPVYDQKGLAGAAQPAAPAVPLASAAIAVDSTSPSPADA